MDPQLLVLLFAATLGGVIIGALPGLNATTGAALLFAFHDHDGTYPCNCYSNNDLLRRNLCGGDHRDLDQHARHICQCNHMP